MKQKHIQHLYWRASFGIDFKSLTHQKSKSKIVSNLFKDSEDYTPLQLDLSEFSEVKFKSKEELIQQFTEEEIQKFRKQQQNKVRALNYALIDRLTESKSLLRKKMMLFWVNVLSAFRSVYATILDKWL